MRSAVSPSTPPRKRPHWTVEHRSTVIISAVAVAIVLAAVIGGWYYLSAQDEKASLELSQAVRTMDTPLRPAGTPEQPDFPTFTSAKERAQAATEAVSGDRRQVSAHPHGRHGSLFSGSDRGRLE